MTPEELRGHIRTLKKLDRDLDRVADPRQKAIFEDARNAIRDNFCAIVSDPYRAPDKLEALSQRVLYDKCYSHSAARKIMNAFKARFENFPNGQCVIKTPHLIGCAALVASVPNFMDRILVAALENPSIENTRDIPTENVYGFDDLNAKWIEHPFTLYVGDKGVVVRGFVSWPEFWSATTLDTRIDFVLGLHERVGADAPMHRAMNGPMGEEKVLSHILSYGDHPLAQIKEHRMAVIRKKKQRMPSSQSSSSSLEPSAKRSNVRDAEDDDDDDLNAE
jgi:hypothetical protein